MIIVDTDVIVAHLRGLDAARQWLRETRARSGQLSMSVLTSAEIVGGMRSPERRGASGAAERCPATKERARRPAAERSGDVTVYQLLDSIRPLPTTDTIARRAGDLRRRHHRSHGAISTVDYVIAATAEVHDLELATLNVKHFPMFVDLRAPFTL